MRLTTKIYDEAKVREAYETYMQDLMRWFDSRYDWITEYNDEGIEIEPKDPDHLISRKALDRLLDDIIKNTKK